jgi:hypothetical protein
MADQEEPLELNLDAAVLQRLAVIAPDAFARAIAEVKLEAVSAHATNLETKLAEAEMKLGLVEEAEQQIDVTPLGEPPESDTVPTASPIIAHKAPDLTA